MLIEVGSAFLAGLGFWNSPTHCPASAIRELCASEVEIYRASEETKTVEMQGQITWKAVRDKHPDADITYFVFDPVMGLMDMDFHRIDDKGWEHMRATEKGAVAQVEITQGTSMFDINRVLQLIATKGGYETIEVKMRER